MLLVCYDESWPAYLDTARGEPAFACAMVLAAGAVEGAVIQIGRPVPGKEALISGFETLIARMPILAGISLLSFAAAGGEAQNIPVSPVESGWQVRVNPSSRV